MPERMPSSIQRDESVGTRPGIVGSSTSSASTSACNSPSSQRSMSNCAFWR